jgi:hypothetical protein
VLCTIVKVSSYSGEALGDLSPEVQMRCPRQRV